MRLQVDVVTYAYAYIPGQVSLCRRCAEHPPVSLGVLGSVQHGEHRGWCEVCQAEELELGSDDPDANASPQRR